MATLMEQMIDRLRALPAESQDRFARFVLHELSSDADWQRTTDAHPAAVRRLVDEVRAADGRGETEPLVVDRL